MPFAASMDATGNDYIKWSKSERQRQMPQDITYMWNWKYDTNEPIYEIETEKKRRNRNRITDKENRLMVAKRQGSREGMEWGGWG